MKWTLSFFDPRVNLWTKAYTLTFNSEASAQAWGAANVTIPFRTIALRS